MNKSRRFKAKRRRRMVRKSDRLAGLFSGWIKHLARGKSFARSILGLPQL